MTVADTSIIAYKEHKALGKVGKQAQALFDYMDFGIEYSRKELARSTGMELSSVCGRVNEMLEVGMLKEGDKRKCKITGKLISPVYKYQLF